MQNNDIEQIISLFEENKNDFAIWIVANVNDTVQSSESFIKHCEVSEYFTKIEFSSIVSAITETFGYVRIFYSELEFIKYVLSNHKQIDTMHTIIFNFTRDGLFEGKKSLIPAFCDLFGLNYIGSNPFVTSLLRNKFVFSKFLEAMNIPVPNTSIYNAGLYDESKFSEGNPIIAKNVSESASIGMNCENIIFDWNSENISTKLDSICKKLNTKQLLIQDYIEGIECETFVVNIRGSYYAFQPIAISIHGSNIITSTISNLNDYSFFPLDEQCNIQTCNSIMKATEKAAKLLNIKNYARFDYRIKKDGSFYLIDIAGSPYLTKHSSISYLFTKIIGIEYKKIFSFLAALADINQSYEVNCKSDNNRPLEK